MKALLTLFANNLLPILLISGLGYLLGWRLNVQARSVARMVFYALSPFLVFDLMARSRLSNSDISRMMGFAIFQAAA
ncbi:MAG: hypothetical protein D6803_01325, partial [Anaerolineae bacterium]